MRVRTQRSTRPPGRSGSGAAGTKEKGGGGTQGEGVGSASLPTPLAIRATFIGLSAPPALFSESLTNP